MSWTIFSKKAAVDLYQELLAEAEDASVYIEEYARQMIGQEELHILELRKMVRDFEEIKV